MDKIGSGTRMLYTRSRAFLIFFKFFLKSEILFIFLYYIYPPQKCDKSILIYEAGGIDKIQ